ncbi:hypothetical protein NDU88_003252 [Pleurodeles waltl]|uniref:Uncharacterized protein n=1 Tax=Pleurodeles waltl TaxID=8319 RepID=A0AAV7WNL1_PLEWA|nr:hypothetical protein NDU88_003252 [Pleurodeles waltl]
MCLVPSLAAKEVGSRNGKNLWLRTAATATAGIGSDAACRDTLSRGLVHAASPGARVRTKEIENAAPPTPPLPRTRLLRTQARELFPITITYHQPPPRPPSAAEETGLRNGGTLRLRTAAKASPGIGLGTACSDALNRGLVRAASPGARARAEENEDAAPPTPRILYQTSRTIH